MKRFHNTLDLTTGHVAPEARMQTKRRALCTSQRRAVSNTKRLSGQTMTDQLCDGTTLSGVRDVGVARALVVGERWQATHVDERQPVERDTVARHGRVDERRGVGDRQRVAGFAAQQLGA